MRQKIIAGNWKMNKTLPEAIELINNLHEETQNWKLPQHLKIVLCPPYPFIDSVYNILRLFNRHDFELGAQNCHQAESGAYTGEVSAAMLASIKANYVIIGHSERRSYFAETNDLLRQKVDVALKNNLNVIFCCGENLQQRESGAHFDTVSTQLSESLLHLKPEQWQAVIIAYEPIWAIGTGKTATPTQAQDMHAHIRQFIEKNYGTTIAQNTSILYGGSCNATNAPELFNCPDIDGGLIGGAALKAQDFAAIIAAYIPK